MLAPFGVIGVLAAAAATFGVSLCPFATLTGLPCPGCGILRALLSLAQGDVAASFRTHPLAPFAAGAVLAFAWMLRLGAPSRRFERNFSLFAGTLAASMIALWLARFQGALGGPVPVNSVWSALETPSPFVHRL